MGLLERFRSPLPTLEQLIQAGDPPEVAAWKLTGPPPGEVYMYTGEPPATEAAKVRADFSEDTWAALRRVGEIARTEALWAEEHPEAAAARVAGIQAGVDETLRSIGVDPRTLLPIAEQL
jgi:hypothetical protein